MQVSSCFLQLIFENMFNACVFLQQDVEPLGSVVYDLGSPLMLFCTRGILFLPFCCFHRSQGRLAIKQEYFTILLRLQGLLLVLLLHSEKTCNKTKPLFFSSWTSTWCWCSMMTLLVLSLHSASSS